LKANYLIKVLLLFFLSCQLYLSAQLTSGNCVRGGGIGFLLDAYLASIGACNCQKEIASLYSFPKCNNNSYEIVFEDNFNDLVLDTSKWEIQGYGQGAIQGGQNIEYNSLDNVSLSDGVCHIIAKKETVLRKLVNWQDSNAIQADGLPNLRIYNYTSSNLWTKKKFFHGKYEIRCRMPSGKGFWPAFWMFGGKRWNEIDVFDSYAGVKTFVTSIGHDYEGIGKASGCNKYYGGYDLTEWHTFTCLFEFDKISILIDGDPVRIIYRVETLSGQPVSCGDNISAGNYFHLKSFPIERMNVIINLALISENGPGGSVPLDADTPLPSSFDIDYVRIWEKSGDGEYISVLPNPTQSKVTIKVSNVPSSLKVSNALGEIIYNGIYLNELDLSQLQAGIYFITANFSDCSKTAKVIKVNP
jgi:beta-glucanase (GH16 family)